MKRTVFLVDDHPLVREWLANLINRQPDLHVCGEAEGAPSALQQISAIKPDIAILDITLVHGSGLELIKDLKCQCPKTAIIVLSMHDESLYAERALRAGAKGYVMKRETTKKIIAAIRQVLEGKLYVSDHFSATLTERLAQGKKPGVSPIEELSDRELEVFDLIGQGVETRLIAESLGISIKTVQVYCSRIKDKLNLNNATELLREAVLWCEAEKTK